MHKIAKDNTQSFNMFEDYEDKPHGFIQWKGTDVSMDIYCKCGAGFHISGIFAYNVRCPYCQTVYAVGCFVELVELLNPPPDDKIISGEKDDE